MPDVDVMAASNDTEHFICEEPPLSTARSTFLNRNPSLAELQEDPAAIQFLPSPGRSSPADRHLGFTGQRKHAKSTGMQ